MSNSAAILVQPYFDLNIDLYDQLVSLHPKATTPINVHQDIIDRVLAYQSIEWDKITSIDDLFHVAHTTAPLRAPDRYGHRLREHWQHLLNDDYKIAAHIHTRPCISHDQGTGSQFSTGLGV